jgi:FkbM family methyltransferase
MKTKQIKEFSFNVNDNPIYKDFWNDDAWETFTYDCVEKFSKKDGIFIDIGAWIGPITMYASRLNKKCYSVEPDKIAYDELLLNLSLNESITNTICQQIAIYNIDGNIELGSESFGNSNTRVNTDRILNVLTPIKDYDKVKCQTVSTFMKTNEIDVNKISMIKIDVEGAEVEIIQDSFFKDNPNIPVHLSLHPPLFKQESYSASIKTIYDFCSNYKYFISEHGSNITDILNTQGFHSIMLLNNPI